MWPELIWVVFFFLLKYFLSECFSFQKEKNKTRKKTTKQNRGPILRSSADTGRRCTLYTTKEMLLKNLSPIRRNNFSILPPRRYSKAIYSLARFPSYF